MPPEALGRREDANDALVRELVEAYSPAVLQPTGKEARNRAEMLSATVRRIVEEVVREAHSQAAVVRILPNPPDSTPPPDSAGQLGGPPRPEVGGTPPAQDWISDELWRRLVQPHFNYADHISSNRFQAQLSQVQRDLVRSFAPADDTEVDSAILDLLSESLRERGESRPPHPFRDFLRYRTERDWWRYFSKSAERRYVRNLMKWKRERVGEQIADAGLSEPAEDPDVERASLERRLALQEIDNLPATFTNTQRDILKHILQGHPLAEFRHYSEGYVRKVLRKAISYFQTRG